MRSVLQEILNDGEPALKKLLGRAEDFELEFKTKENCASHILSKTDKRNIGKALSGFSNADGGLVIFGISTVRTDQQDIATEFQPIMNIERFRSEVEGRLGELIRPDNPSIKVYKIESTNNPSAGYLLIDISTSNFRPHMSMAPGHQKYYRRSVDGTLVMDHSMIRDQMMASKDAEMRLKWRTMLAGSSQYGGKILIFELILELENVGLAMAAMPYARLSTNPAQQPITINGDVSISRRMDGSIAYYASNNAVIHPSDIIQFGGLRISAVIENITTHGAGPKVSTSSKIPGNWRFGINHTHRDGFTGDEFSVLEVRINYGAKNAQQRSKIAKLSESDLIEMLIDCGYTI